VWTDDEKSSLETERSSIPTPAQIKHSRSSGSEEFSPDTVDTWEGMKPVTVTGPVSLFFLLHALRIRIMSTRLDSWRRDSAIEVRSMGGHLNTACLNDFGTRIKGEARKGKRGRRPMPLRTSMEV